MPQEPCTTRGTGGWGGGLMKIPGNEGTLIAGDQGTLIAGDQGTLIAGDEGT